MFKFLCAMFLVSKCVAGYEPFSEQVESSGKAPGPAPVSSLFYHQKHLDTVDAMSANGNSLQRQGVADENQSKAQIKAIQDLLEKRDVSRAELEDAYQSLLKMRHILMADFSKTKECVLDRKLDEEGKKLLKKNVIFDTAYLETVTILTDDIQVRLALIK